MREVKVEEAAGLLACLKYKKFAFSIGMGIVVHGGYLFLITALGIHMVVAFLFSV